MSPMVSRRRWIAQVAHVLAPPLLRVALAVPFFKSGLTKWDGFLSLSPAAVFLFEDEFKLHIFGQAYEFPLPTAVAFLDGVAEIVLPVLLIIGLATRFSALGLLVRTGVIQLGVPEGWANVHLPWAAPRMATEQPTIVSCTKSCPTCVRSRRGDTRDPNDVEDAVQDILLTIHSIRQTYDPARPFGPWLVTIANRRFVDRLRRQGRVRARETSLTTEHETLSEPRANLEESTDRHALEGTI